MSNDFDRTEQEQSVEPSTEAVKPAQVELDKECKSPSDQTQHRVEEALSILMESFAEFNETMEKSPQLNYAADTEGRRWMELVAQAAQHYARGGSFTSSVERESAQWRQHVDNDGERLTAGRPRTSSSEGEGSKLSGERAIFKLTQTLGLGTVVQIPLWHTGIWVTLRAPSDSALLELERRIAEEKIELGRHTNGMVFSNSSVYVNAHLINFILAHVYDSSLRSGSAKNLKRVILTSDLPLLVWGMLCAIYPNGYNFSQPCTANPDSCQHVTTELLNISKLCWTDNGALSAKQKNHMSKRTEKFKFEDLLRYQEEHTHGLPKTVKVHENLSLKFKVPTLETYEASGFKWVDGIVRMVDESFAVELKGRARNDYINQQGRATALRQYAHWINEIHLGEEGYADVIDDVDTIEEAVNRLSADKDVSNKIFESLNDYIDSSTISLIAIPKYNCPSCQQPQAEVHERYPHLIPLGVSQIFFTLLDQRIYRLMEEEAV